MKKSEKDVDSCKIECYSDKAVAWETSQKGGWTDKKSLKKKLKKLDTT
jgi:predicted Rdx family selenoprotein